MQGSESLELLREHLRLRAHPASGEADDDLARVSAVAGRRDQRRKSAPKPEEDGRRLTGARAEATMT
jgi:hypothetical protein